MKKRFLLKVLSLIFTLCTATCVFTACEQNSNTHVHEFSYSTVKTATCVESGSMFGVCSCGETTTITTPQTEHNFVNGVCSFCGFNKGGQDQPCVHSWQEADCLTPKTCSKCGAVEGLALDHSWGEWFETEPATCQKEGEKRRNCERCGYYETRMIFVIDHNFVEGYCSMCGAFDENYHAHSWQEADCLNPKTCLECGAIEGTALGHVEVIDNAVEPDCLNSGLTEGKHCSVCKEVLVAQEVIDALGHNFVDNACVSCGLQVTPAEYFNFELLEDGTYEITAKDRNNMPAEVVIPSSYEGKPVTVIGEYAFTESSSLTKLIIPASITTIENSSEEAPAIAGCVNLKEIMVDANNEYFKAIDGNLYYKDGKTLVQYAIGKTDATFEIPNTVDSIGNYAFAYCSSLTSIEIPDSVTSIGSSAFSNCYSLTSIEIPNSVTSIGNEAFDGCSSLQYNLKDNLKYLGNEENPYLYLAYITSRDITSVNIDSSCKFIGYRAFDGCSRLTSVVVGDSVTSIGYRAFYNCSSLTSVAIPDSVTSIGYQAFYFCRSLTSIEIPNSVTSIGDCAFDACFSLTNIEVDKNNANYKSIDGNLYSKDGKTLIQYAIGKTKTSFEIPDSVTSIGNYAFSNCDSLTSVEIPDSVISIGERAFEDCSSLTNIEVDENNANYKSIDGNLYSKDGKTLIQYAIGKTKTSFVIPDSVTSISERAFMGCSRLTSIKIPDSVTSIGSYAFSGCYSLTSIKIPDSVTSIGDWAFMGCSSLTSIVIPNSVTSIGNYAFDGCDSLTSVVIGNSVTSIGDWAFASCDSLISVVIGDSITSIGERAFHSCYSLTSIVIPDSVTSIGEMAFIYCESLQYNVKDNLNYLGNETNPYLYLSGVTSQYITSANIDNSCKFIGYRAFSNCDSLTSAEIPDSVTSIGAYAFSGCSSLTSIVIPDRVTSIGDYAFESCDSLTNIKVDENNSNYKSIDGNLYSKDGKTLIQYAIGKTKTSFVIPDSVTSISERAFMGCSRLTSIVIPDSVTSIGYSAFYDCNSLTSVEIPDSVISIGAWAFYSCDSLTSIVIPEGVTSIGSDAFYFCSRLTSIVIPDSVTSIGDSAFSNCDSLTSIVIPEGVTSIGEAAFYSCSSLTSIVIPDSVTSIGERAFTYCSSLTSIKYRGTAEEWNAIQKGRNWDYRTGNYTITYNYIGK